MKIISGLFCLIFAFFKVILAQQEVGLAPGLYCGLKSCYDVIGIKRDDFTRTQLAKVYRKLAREFHPDRQPNEDLKKKAETKFREIATAYEILKEDESRNFYDHYLDHPEDRYYNYYQYYRMKAAPKVDVRYVILATILIISVFQYYSAKQKYADSLSYACGVQKYRNKAIQDAIERKIFTLDTKGKVVKNKSQDQDAIICSIIEENMNLQGGFKKETIYDTVAWELIVLPITLFKTAVWGVKWYYKYNIRNEEYSEEDKVYMICKNLAITENQYLCMDEDELDDIHNNECWIKDKALDYKEKKELLNKEKLNKSAHYRRYKRIMKANVGNTISFMED
uniref:J domain-containing protein n=1 Tax=Rhabditophanes sp. KR3021 TaxID=114890 RepID=A0AC35TY88_9BILA